MKRLVLAGAVALTMAGCAPHTPMTSSSTLTVTDRPSTLSPVSPIHPGPTTFATARSCPFLDEQSAADDLGMRLDAIEVLSIEGKTIGCRFYPLGHPNAQCDTTCLQNEHLPPPSQPAIEITSNQYPTEIDAERALVLLAKAGTNANQHSLHGSAGACFQTDFYPKDRGTDWSCAYTNQATLVQVKTVADGPALGSVITMTNRLVTP